MRARRSASTLGPLRRSAAFRAVTRVVLVTVLASSVPLDGLTVAAARAQATDPSATQGQAPSTLYVNGDAGAACGGRTPCFGSIQAAIDAVGPGQRIEIQAGTYTERLRFHGVNARATGEVDRIVVEADPAAPVGSVVLGGTAARCEGGYAIQLDRSRYVTLRGLTIVNAGTRGVGLLGGSRENRAIHLERLRLARGGPRECNGGIDVGRGNPGTVIANSLIYGNGRNGIRFRDGRGGSYVVAGNTIAGNAWSGVQIAHAVALELIDNLIVGNGTSPGPSSTRVGVRRLKTNPSPASLVRLRGNLICGNAGGELSGPILDASDSANATPTGSEGPGVAASPSCGDPGVLFRDVDGADDQPGTADDDFHLAAGSPAIDFGVDPRALALPVANDLLEADFDGPAARPRDGDGDREAAFDAGAHESAGDVEPTPTRTPTSTPSASPTPSGSPSPTPQPSASPSPSPSQSPQPSASPTPAPTPVGTPIATATTSPVCEETLVIDVPGTSNPWLAGMPDGSTEGSDRAPEQSPVLVAGLVLTPGASLSFAATGCSSYVPGGCSWGPDSSNVAFVVTRGDVNGIGRSTAPANALVGVFLDDARPDTSSSPAPLSFAPGDLGTTFTSLAPALKQPFFIGDGLTGAGTGDRQAFVVPAGATRLYLATMDGVEWGNNSGTIVVTIDDACVAPTATPAGTATPTSTPTSSPTATPAPTAVVTSATPAPSPSATPAPTPSPTPTQSARPGNLAPVARGNAYALRADQTLRVGAPGVLANDSDPDRDALLAVKLTEPLLGDVVFNRDGSFEYTPDAESLTCPAASARPGISFVQSRSTPLSFSNDGSAVYGLAKGDFDHDGNVDLAVGGTGNIPGIGSGGFVATMRGNGDGTFQAPLLLLGLGSEAPTGALARDLDGDGQLDLLFAVSASSRLLLFKGAADGSFAAPATIGVSHPDGVQSADLNGDQVLDLVTFGSDNTVAVLVGNGDGTFQSPTVYPIGSGPQDLAIGDLNGDHAPDLVVGIVNATEIDVLLSKNDGSGAFDAARTFNPGMQVRGLYLGYFDGDANLDAVTAGAGCPQGFPPTTLNNGTGCMVFLAGNGEGGFSAPRTQDFIGLEGDFPGRLYSENVTPDLNADGKPDVVFLGGPQGSGNYVFAALGNGQGGFAMTRYIMSRGPAPAPGPQLAGSGIQVDRVHGQPVLFDDFDGDGIADIVAGNAGITRPGGVSLLRGTTSGTFAAARSFSLPEDGLDLNSRFGATGAVALGDFTHGGPLELAVVASGVFTVGELRVVTVGTDGSITSPTSVVSDGAFSEFHSRFMRTADFDRDGNLDVVYLGLGGGPAPRVLVRYGDGAGHLTAAVTLGYSGSNLWNVVTDDFDGDGFPDLAVYRGPFGGVAGIDVYRANGIGRGFTLVGTAGGSDLGPAVFSSLGDLGKAAMVAADFDRDGIADLMVSRGVDGAAGANPQKSYFLRGLGNGTFSPPVVVGGLTSNGGGISDFAAADLDHDGKLDLIGSSAGFVSVQRGQGDGTFEPVVEYGSATGGITQMAVADFDRDGHQDVAVIGDNVPYGLSVLPGRGDGTLDVVATRKVAVGEIRAVGIAAGDLNGDGKTDLIVEHDGQHFNHFTVLLNDAEPTFGCTSTDHFTYRAHDGSDPSNVATVELRIAPVDHAPVITSVPLTTALVGQAFTYQVTATDQDAGDVLAYGLITAPTGMSIDPDGGLVRWIPAASQNGSTTVTVRVHDSAGLSAEQTFPVSVRASVTVPDVVGQTQAGAGSAIAGASLTLGPVTTRSSATVPAGNVINQTPLAGTRVAQGTAVSLVVSSGPPGPGETLASIVVEPADERILVGESVAYRATGVFADGTSADLTSTATWSSSSTSVASVAAGGSAVGLADGTTTIAAASDGITGSTTLTVRARVVGDDVAPDASIAAPGEGAEITEPTTITGTASDANLLAYELEIAPAGTTTFALLARGTASVVNGALATLDPTLLQNGTWIVRLTVRDRGGNVSTAETSYVLTGGLKLGHFTLSFVDLATYAPGISLSLSRNYDSRDKRVGDFGVGWTLELATVKVQKNRPEGFEWTLQQAGLSYALLPTASHYVTVTLPGGEVEQFAFTPTPSSQQFVPLSETHAAYTALSGTRSRLEPVGDTDLLIGGDALFTFGGDPYDPKTFRLIREGGVQYVIDVDEGVKEIVDRNGNHVTITPNGITHSNGRSVTIVRDAQHRITSMTDMMGRSNLYAYDANGDLVAFTNRRGERTTFAYDRNHHMLRMTGPGGVHAVRNRYDDDGRMIAQADALGAETLHAYDPTGRRHTLTDRLGHAMLFESDARGNIVHSVDALGNELHTTYDAAGNPTAHTDGLGHTTTYGVDANGFVRSVTDPLGNVLTADVDASGRLTAAADETGNRDQYGYDAAGNLTSWLAANGQATTYAYDAQGSMTSITAPLGRFVQFTYDAFGNPTSRTDHTGQTVTSTYDANGNAVQTTRTVDGRALTYATEYDELGEVATFTDPAGRKRRLERDIDGKVVKFVDEDGRETRYEYDPRGLVTRITYPDGTFETKEYDAEERPVRETDRLGHVMVREYDAIGRTVRTIAPDGAEQGTSYDAAHEVVGETLPDGSQVHYEYDAAGRTTRIVGPSGDATEMEYDAAGRPVRRRGGLGQDSRWEYDALGRMVREIDPIGGEKHFSFDAVGRLASTTDPLGRTTSVERDADGHVTAAIDALGNRWTYTYDALDRMRSMTDALGRSTRWEYDALGRLVRETLPLGQSRTWSYDTRNRATSITDFDGRTATYEYFDDERGLLKARHYPDGSSVSFTYSATGNPLTVTDARGVTTYQYDAKDRVKRVDEPDGAFVAYGYDGRDRLTTITAPHGTTTYGWDARDQLVQVTDPDGGVTQYTYDASGQRVGELHPDGTTTTLAYDDRGVLTAIEHRAAGGALLASFAYESDAVGQRTRVVEGTGRTVDYAYDAAGRLTSETVTEPGGSPETTSYTYDAVGNRLTRSTSAGTTSYAYDDNDRVLSAGATTFVHDANGNLTERTAAPGTQRYEYDFENRLVRSVPPVGSATDYAYDFAGNRVRKSTGAAVTQYLVAKMNPTAFPQVLRETDAAGAEIARHTYGHELLSSTRAGNRSVVLRDGRDSVRLLTDPTGAVTDTFTYDAYGVPTAHAGTSAIEHGFNAEMADPESGLQYLRARRYDPQLGRFTSRDTLFGSAGLPRTLNRYVYTGGDPVNAADPSGHSELGSEIAANSIRMTLVQIQFNVGMDVLFLAQDLQAGLTMDQAMNNWMISTALGVGMLALPSVFRMGSAVRRTRDYLNTALSVAPKSGGTKFMLDMLRTGVGLAERPFMLQANAHANQIHKRIMRQLGFAGHDWSKNWAFFIGTATKGRDLLTDWTIKLHNKLEWQHHGASRTLAQAREKTFDIIFACLEQARTPLMTQARLSIDAMQENYEWIIRKVVNETAPELRAGFINVEAEVRGFAREAFSLYGEVEDLILTQNPYGKMEAPVWSPTVSQTIWGWTTLTGIRLFEGPEEVQNETPPDPPSP